MKVLYTMFSHPSWFRWYSFRKKSLFQERVSPP